MRKYIIILGVCIIVLTGVRVLQLNERKKELEPGMKFLLAQENQSIKKNEEKIKETQDKNFQKQLDEKRQAILEGKIDIWSLFSNIMILGDSRAVGFSVFGCIPSNQVVAAGGNTIMNIEEAAPKIEAMSPSVVFLCYGVNDIGLGDWPTPEKYSADYIKIVKKMEKKFPNTKFLVNSTLPTEEKAFSKNPAWERIPEYNAVLKEECKKNHIGYVDCTELIQKYSDFYDVSDGIHMQKEFYPYWGTQMILTMEKEEMNQGE